MSQLLVVAQDPETRAVLHDLLEEAGYTVTAAPPGRKVLAHLRSHPEPLVVLVDQTMLEWDLLETALDASPPQARRAFLLLTTTPERVPARLGGRLTVIGNLFDLDQVLEAVAAATAQLNGPA